MRTKYVETYQTAQGTWTAATLDPIRPMYAIADTEAEALGTFCDRLYEMALEQAGYPEEWA